MLTQCCVCHRFQQDDQWIASGTHDHKASHTYCPDCVVAVWAEIRAVKKTYRSPVDRPTFRIRAYHEERRPLAQLGEES